MDLRRSFHPDTPGARRLARTWLPQLERWKVRGLHGVHLRNDGNVVAPGDTMDVSADRGRELVQLGTVELISRRRVGAHD